MNEALLIRADASAEIGLGHVMRCLALAQAWRQNGRIVVFAMQQPAVAVTARLATEGIETVSLKSPAGSDEDALETAQHAERIRAAWIVVDGYVFRTGYRQALKDAGFRLCLIDDLGGSGPYCADIVLNQNLYASAALFPGLEPSTRLLLGPRYVLLRREFARWRGWNRSVPPRPRRLLITLGGGDRQGVALKAVEAVEHLDLPDLKTIVVVGSATAHRSELEAAASKCRGSVVIRYDVTDMGEVMAGADLALSNAGSTCWELAFMQLPAALIQVAENQIPLANEMERSGISVNLGWHGEATPPRIAATLRSLALDAERRASIAKRSRMVIDGRGTMRVAARLLLPSVTLRRASMEDGELLWSWRNDPVVRSLSFVSDPIPWPDHVQWLRHKLEDPRCSLYIGIGDENRPVGQIRVEASAPREVEVHISVDPCTRGCGYGPAMLVAIQRELFRFACVDTIHAYIKPGNRASTQAFEKAGFVDQGLAKVSGQSAHHYRCAVGESLS